VIFSGSISANIAYGKDNASREEVRRAADAFGNQAIVVAVDARREPGSDPLRWEVYTHGGRRPTGIDAVAWCERVAGSGAGEILLTSMDRDGTRDGFDLELTRAVADKETAWREAIAAGQSLPAATGIDDILASQADAVRPAEGG